jgi:hypothetical protein
MTRMGPVVALVGTVAVIELSEFTVYVADTLLKVTEVAPQKFVPLIDTDDPTFPLVGENEVIVGAPPASTVKLVVLAVPPG